MAVALALLTATSAAAQRVSFPSFTGPSAANVRNQIVGAVCDTADCIAATKTTTNGKPDWKKAKKESVAYFVTGNVAKRGSALSLELAVFSKAGAPKAKKSYPLEKAGTLSAKNLQSALDMLAVALGRKGGGSAPPVESDTPPVETARPAPAPSSSSSSKGPTRPSEPPPPPAESKRAREEGGQGEAPAPKPGQKRKPKFLVIDVGAELLNRRLEYSQVATANLRRYELTPFFAQPTLGLEFYPLALVRDDLLAGLGLEVSTGFAPWLQSRLTSIPDSFATSAVRFDAGVRWNIAPIPTWALTFSPYVGVRSQSFTISPLPDGRRIDGLPNIGLVGLRVGLGLDVPVVPNWVGVFGRFGIVPVFGSGEIISASFFPNGSAFGLEANAGVSVNFTSFLQLRLSFEWMNYGFTFSTQPTDTYVAAGATDTYLGGRAGLRFMF
jgi:hypothetical protein